MCLHCALQHNGKHDGKLQFLKGDSETGKEDNGECLAETRVH